MANIYSADRLGNILEIHRFNRQDAGPALPAWMWDPGKKQTMEVHAGRNSARDFMTLESPLQSPQFSPAWSSIE